VVNKKPRSARAGGVVVVSLWGNSLEIAHDVYASRQLARTMVMTATDHAHDGNADDTISVRLLST
jgi:hypothetical protein